jgi:chromosomal replication initiation ATPase DnaA
MRDLDQTLIKFDNDKNFKNEDFYLSKSNKHVFDFLNIWPKWEKNFVNVIGERLSGKTHLMNIFLQKNKGIIFDSKSLRNDDLKKIKIYENIIIENLSSDVDEKLLYSLLNLIEQDNKFIIVTSVKPIVNIAFDLKDLRSRAKNFILLNIEKPDDELIFAIILKNLSDRQITLDDKFIEFIIKRIERSYSKIYDFIYKIDQLSLKKKKSIDFKIIKEVLGE